MRRIAEDQLQPFAQSRQPGPETGRRLMKSGASVGDADHTAFTKPFDVDVDLASFFAGVDLWLVTPVAAFAGVSALVLFLSAMGLFSLMSISVSRRTREIGLRVALGAHPRHVLGRIVAHAMVLMGSGVAAGGGLVLLSVALGSGPTGRPADDVVSFAAWIGVTAAVMLGAGLLACVEPARRALKINPIDALRDA